MPASSRAWIDRFKQGWFKHYKKIFIVVFVLIIAAGSYVWYVNLYKAHWSEEQKQQYIQTQEKKEVFKEQDFNETLRIIEERQQAYEAEPLKMQDIFQANN